MGMENIFSEWRWDLGHSDPGCRGNRNHVVSPTLLLHRPASLRRHDHDALVGDLRRGAVSQTTTACLSRKQWNQILGADLPLRGAHIVQLNPPIAYFMRLFKIIFYTEVLFITNIQITMKTLFKIKIYMLYWRNYVRSGCARAGFHCTYILPTLCVDFLVSLLTVGRELQDTNIFC